MKFTDLLEASEPKQKVGTSNFAKMSREQKKEYKAIYSMPDYTKEDEEAHYAALAAYEEKWQIGKHAKPTPPKFKIGDFVEAKGELGVITGIDHQPPDEHNDYEQPEIGYDIKSFDGDIYADESAVKKAARPKLDVHRFNGTSRGALDILQRAITSGLSYHLGGTPKKKSKGTSALSRMLDDYHHLLGNWTFQVDRDPEHSHAWLITVANTKTKKYFVGIFYTKDHPDFDEDEFVDGFGSSEKQIFKALEHAGSRDIARELWECGYTPE